MLTCKGSICLLENQADAAFLLHTSEKSSGSVFCTQCMNSFLQAMKVSHCEKEILKYKEKLNEMEFYKSRVEVCDQQLKQILSSLFVAEVSANNFILNVSPCLNTPLVTFNFRTILYEKDHF